MLPFSTTDIVYTTPDIVTAQGSFSVTAWVDQDSDSYHYNDTAFTRLNGAAFIPAKRLTIESGEGTWNEWSVRNMAYLGAVADSGVSASIISVHHDDVMIDSVYDDFLTDVNDNYVPYMLFDRRVSVPIDSFFSYLSVQKNYFGYADITVNGNYHYDTLMLTGLVTPAIDMIAGDYRLAVVITEDGVTGTTADYNQANRYAANAYGPMYGYESLPNPVPASDMVYDHVARLISPTPLGTYGVLPYYAYAGTAYDYSFTIPIDSAWRPEKLKAIVMLINNSDTTIMNSNEIAIPLKTVDLITQNIPHAGIYPNPSADQATVYFNIPLAEKVQVSLTDMSGRQLFVSPSTLFTGGRGTMIIPVRQLSAGIYLVNVFFEQGRQTLKLEVVH